MTDQPLEPDESRASQTPSEAEPEVESEVEPEVESEVEPEVESEEPTTQTMSSAPTEATPPPQVAPRRLYRSSDDQVVAGVCGGLGEYFGVDSTLIRIGFVLLVFAGGAGILAYILAWIFIPEAPADASAAATAPAAPRDDWTSGAVLLGLAFVVLGAFFLLDELWPDFLSWKYVWPVALVAVGLGILLRGRR